VIAHRVYCLATKVCSALDDFALSSLSPVLSRMPLMLKLWCELHPKGQEQMMLDYTREDAIAL
jgi:hypothetical protein